MSTPNTHYGAKRITELLSPDRCKKVFFCGIGGINVSSLAHITLCEGYKVSGSDRTKSAITEALQKEGAEVFYSHDAKNLDGCDAFVYTVAISPDNPEYVRAGEMGIPRISRADYLGYIMTKYENRIGVCGTHGKSTTTAMCSSIFEEAGRAPTVMCGAELQSCGSAYLAGGKRDFIFEACEYMDSFLHFNPTVSVLLNVELDHVDYFKSIDQMRRSYASFLALAGDNGCAVYNADDEEAVAAASGFSGRSLSFGIENRNAELLAVGLTEKRGRFSFDIELMGEHFAHIELAAAGKHNVLNALAAAGAAILLGVPSDAIERGLSSFGGTHRRMEYRGQLNGAELYDDYAHHPTEIQASLKSARSFGDGRLICLFQSHTYSRTHALLEDFAKALSLADIALIAPIYSAREVNESGVSQYSLAERIDGAIGCEDLEECAERLKSLAKPNDTLVIMGAGDIFKVFDMLDK